MSSALAFLVISSGINAINEAVVKPVAFSALRGKPVLSLENDPTVEQHQGFVFVGRA